MSGGTPPARAPIPERAALLESLRGRIARGEYLVPAELVADAILQAWAREWGDAGPSMGPAGAQAG